MYRSYWGFSIDHVCQLDQLYAENYYSPMDTKLRYKQLIEKIEALDPLLVRAIDEVDETLIDEFKALSIDEKIRRASEGAAALAEFETQ
ncbi:MAG: hypothetical protein QNJ97_29030 [Myxococcota bacterium]|nr:hypothetical protein [Myxococcota bacterium]